ncbi:HAD family hydrolase [Oribacterium sp. WCC10]|uniref:HAD family hydrolase n=1 Tax=Oribacterium sp. WCC10 TaxID=1855343 RepID=UPI0008F4090B|nr:HAD hydrolase-like protein [Oribacterium sp. WCC10]SFG68527.1 Haloacid dehalogenase-like hydrolase [Oribacterium sp. WCC10]
MSKFDEYSKKNKKIVCIDSDGCAMDTMNIKHIRCFGPCMVKEWELSQWESEILERWNEINLYSMTRGINRFKGLAMMLCEINEKYRPIDGIKALKTWAEEAPELSNSAVQKMMTEDDIFRKALNWSKAVNVSIGNLPKEEIKPFEGVKEAFEKIHERCDIAVVSSANREAVVAEWERFGLLPYVDILCTQDMGSKAFCIGEILKKGFETKDVLMCGDAPGDEAAAAENEVSFYPILVNHENKSWKRLKDEALEKFLEDAYEGNYQKKMIEEFRENLK